jgi:hypothetical protein
VCFLDMNRFNMEGNRKEGWLLLIFFSQEVG